MLRSGLVILTLFCLSWTVGAIGDSRINFNIVMQKLEALDKKIDTKLQEMNSEIKEIKSDVASLKQSGKAADLKIAHGSTDIEKRVGDLEGDMSIVKIGLTGIADSVNDLQEADNQQDRNILSLRAQVCQ